MTSSIINTAGQRHFHYSLSIGWFHTDLPVEARFEAAKADGFGAVEMFWPTESLPAIRRAVQSTGVHVVLVNMFEGDYSGGERGFLCWPTRQAEWRRSFREALALCQTIDCPLVNVLTGDVPLGMSREAAKDVAKSNLQWAEPLAREAGVRMVIEPLNHLTHPSYLCQRTCDVLDLIDDLPKNTVGLQYDVYHAQCSEGNILRTLRADIDRIFHIQVADVPTRAAPGTGEINFSAVLGEIASLDYRGFVGLEYEPNGYGDPLSWLPLAERA